MKKYSGIPAPDTETEQNAQESGGRQTTAPVCLAMMSEVSLAVPPAAQADGVNDYDLIEKAIEYLDTHFLDQPTLAEVAGAVGLSDFHFQRVFTRWAGVSPKRFVQALTVEHAKQQLARSRDLLHTAIDSGLSGPGRLHDLFVSAEAVTPGEYKTRGAGIRIEYGFHSTPFGICLLGTTQRGICWLSFLEAGDKASALRDLRSRWSGAEMEEQPSKTSPIAEHVFSRLCDKRQAPLGVLLMGTNFQIKVWRALLKIPAGSALCYESLSGWVGVPKAARAVGAAVGANPIAYLIPCHRVIRKTGLLGGYRWGQNRKRVILAWEAALINHPAES
jgi:AraC family transcriptional regulator, regulatory protein of adaptative response / methylated-DNA-[protein]-cysteine methyltransferase